MMDPVSIAPAHRPPTQYGTINKSFIKPVSYDIMFWRLAFAITCCLLMTGILLILMQSQYTQNNRHHDDNDGDERNNHGVLEGMMDHCNTSVCPDEYLLQFCKLLPTETSKLVRQTFFSVAQDFKPTDSYKIILLVRDPRGVMQARNQSVITRDSPDCRDLNQLCADMVSDYETASRILLQHPEKLLVIRYEDLLLQPNVTQRKITNFLETKNTEFTMNNQSSETEAYKKEINSWNMLLNYYYPFEWKYMLDFYKIQEIQTKCARAMDLWGYKRTDNETEIRSEAFNPITNIL